MSVGAAVMTPGVCFKDGTWVVAESGRTTALHGRDPQREADRQANELLEGKGGDLLVAIGLGLGFLLDALERRGWQGRVLALEPMPETIAPMLERRDWSTWLASGRLRVLKAPDYTGASDCWRWFPGDGPAPPTFVHPVVARLRPEAAAAAREALDRILFDARANAEARRQHGGRYLLNTLRNLRAIATEDSVSALADGAPGVPAIVVAAGPSLDAALSSVRGLQDQALIIAVDTAARPLLAAGIEPHVIVAVDPSESNGRHLLDLPACPGAHLVAEASLDPFAVEAFAGRTFFFAVSDHQPWPWIKAAGRTVGSLRAWGSVLTSAFDLTVIMGCSPVIFVGADLAYPGSRPYARGVSFEEDWQRLMQWGEPLTQQWSEALSRHAPLTEPDVAGGSVRTAAHLLAVRNWLVEQIQKEPTRTFVNATGAGILMGAGIQQRRPEQIAEVIARDRLSANIIRRRREGTSCHRLIAAGVELAIGLQHEAQPAERLLATWQAFASGIDRATVLTALQAATQSSAHAPSGSGADASTRPQAVVEYQPLWLEQLAAAMDLVPLRIPPHRMQVAPGGARVFRFRTTAARIICCALRPQVDAVREDGQPLTQARDLDHVTTGTYSTCRDEVHFRATDDSDPRWNGREYTVMVPPPLAYLEQLPLAEILARGI